jgi:type III restriction enzyme
MEFKFESNQPFQLQAIESVARLFEGQHYVTGKLEFQYGAGLAAISNSLEVDDDAILQNLQTIQSDNELPVDATLEYIEEQVVLFGEEQSVRFPNFSVEMETGTGKTYIYLRTVLELFRRYGLRKFIIVVPSVAVREGVLKTLEITQAHLRQLYDNPPYHYYVYDSAKLSQVRQFALSDSVEIMVMTIDSFNKASINVIHQTTDRLQGETPIHLIQATRPILILDEPQNMVSELRVRALSALNPIFTLRYSATHRNPYNLVYRLTPFEAYQQGLVKRIEVMGVEQEDDVNQAFVKVDDIQSKKNTVTARLSVHKLMKSGTVKEQRITAKFGGFLP